MVHTDTVTPLKVYYTFWIVSFRKTIYLLSVTPFWYTWGESIEYMHLPGNFRCGFHNLNPPGWQKGRDAQFPGVDFITQLPYFKHCFYISNIVSNFVFCALSSTWVTSSTESYLLFSCMSNNKSNCFSKKKNSAGFKCGCWTSGFDQNVNLYMKCSMMILFVLFSFQIEK